MKERASGGWAHHRTEVSPGSTVGRRQARIIAASLFIALFFLWGGAYNTGPIFLAALLKAFGWSHARVGAIIGALSLAVGISAPIAGWLLDHIEARWVMGTGALVTVLGLLGASNSYGFAMLLGSVILVGVGLVFGGGLAYLATRLIGSRLYGVAPEDPVTMVSAISILLVVAFGAAYLPARRASRLDPVVALRHA